MPSSLRIRGIPFALHALPPYMDAGQAFSAPDPQTVSPSL